jgi:uncharacterized circularly permuted ATP-grasp superfamily protein
MQFDTYEPQDFYDELFAARNQPRPEAALLVETINSLPPGEVQQRQQIAENMLRERGVTFKAFSDDSQEVTEHIFPLDIIPRLITTQEWSWLEQGLKQRIQALNLFLADVYQAQKIIKDRVIPREVVESANGFLKPCLGLQPPRGIWCHITGTDLVRDREGQWRVLEDNLRIPSGISYALENRRVMESTFPELFEIIGIQPVDQYPQQLLKTLQYLAPPELSDPTVVLLTTGANDSAYFEHTFLAQQMGIELVESQNLVVADGYLQMHAHQGLQQVDVIYRRFDDNKLDPLVFNDSESGVPGLMEVYRAGRVAIANAPGAGIADNKVIYAYVPQMIRYYLNEDAILPNVDTYLCWEQQDHVLANLDKLVVKPAGGYGGAGILMGPSASPAARQEFAEKIKANPRGYIAQPTLSLSRIPSLVGDHFEGCHVDLRPFVLYGEEIYVHPGGLTRVALKKGSLVVNSSQGGGSKDTWILTE